jgi:hypothetical protein
MPGFFRRTDTRHASTNESQDGAPLRRCVADGFHMGTRIPWGRPGGTAAPPSVRGSTEGELLCGICTRPARRAGPTPDSRGMGGRAGRLAPPRADFRNKDAARVSVVRPARRSGPTPDSRGMGGRAGRLAPPWREFR